MFTDEVVRKNGLDVRALTLGEENYTKINNNKQMSFVLEIRSLK